MRTAFNWISILATAFLLFGSGTHAQSERTKSNDLSLIGVWLVTIDGEANTRTLLITEDATATSGIFPGAKYGMSGGNLPPVEAKLLKSGDVRRIHITTQANSIIAADEQHDGTFKGTFTLKTGTVKPALISRVADGSIPQAAAKKDMVAMIPIPTGLPVDCTAFHGNWSGRWSQGGFGEQFLRIVEVSIENGKCMIRFSYTGNSTPAPAKLTAEVNSGSFSFLCNRFTNGTCDLKLSGDELWASYSNTTGGHNNAVFRKVK